MKKLSSLFLLSFLLFSFEIIEAKNNYTILFLGDSLTEGYGVEKEQSYPSLLKVKFKNSGYDSIRIINAGISGSTSASAVGRLKWFKKVSPDIIVLALGGNDGLRGYKIPSIKNNLRKTIHWAKKNQIKIYLAGIKIPPNYGQEYTKKFEAVFSELAEEEQIPFLPFLLEGIAGNPLLMQADGIHPNASGHKKMADLVFTFLKNKL